MIMFVLNLNFSYLWMILKFQNYSIWFQNFSFQSHKDMITNIILILIFNRAKTSTLKISYSTTHLSSPEKREFIFGKWRKSEITLFIILELKYQFNSKIEEPGMLYLIFTIFEIFFRFLIWFYRITEYK